MVKSVNGSFLKFRFGPWSSFIVTEIVAALWQRRVRFAVHHGCGGFRRIAQQRFRRDVCSVKVARKNPSFDVFSSNRRTK